MNTKFKTDAGAVAAKGNQRKILVRSILLSQQGEAEYYHIKPGMGSYGAKHSHRIERFHLVDLELNKFVTDVFPSLPNLHRRGKIIALPRSIFILSPLSSLAKCEGESVFEISPTFYMHMSASLLRFADDFRLVETWTLAPFSRDSYLVGDPIFTCLAGDAYMFGTTTMLDPAALQFDTEGMCLGFREGWKSLAPLPSELVGCRPMPLVFADPTNSRILAHLYGGSLPSPSLYAFYPHKDDQGIVTGCTWKCLSSDFTYDFMRNVFCAALLDGILYFHFQESPNLVVASEVATAQWLKVEWSTRVINKHYNLDNLNAFDSLFCLDDAKKIMSFAVYFPTVESWDSVELVFFKFRVKRRESTLRLIPLPTNKYELPSCDRVLDFLPL